MPHVATTVARDVPAPLRTSSTAGSRLPKAVRDAERMYAAGYTVFAHPHAADGRGARTGPAPPALAPMHRIVPAQAAAETAPRAIVIAAALKDERAGGFSKDGTLGALKGSIGRGLLKTKSARAHGNTLSRRDSKAAPPLTASAGSSQQQQQPTLAEAGLGAVGRMKSLRVPRTLAGSDAGGGPLSARAATPGAQPPVAPADGGAGAEAPSADSTSGTGGTSGGDGREGQDREPYDELLIDRIAEPERAEAWEPARPRLSAVYAAGDSAARGRGAPAPAPAPLPGVRRAPAAQISVEVQSLQFDSCEFEPLFGTLFLYNRTAGAVASEPFAFCVARDHVNLTVGLIGDMRRRATAVFTVPLPAAPPQAGGAPVAPQAAGGDRAGRSNSGAEQETTLFEEYLVLRVDKIAQDDTLTAVADAYSKPRGSLSTAGVDDLRKRFIGVVANQQRPFAHETLAWSCIPLIRYKTAARAGTGTGAPGSPGYLCVDEGQQSFTTFFKHNPSEPDMIALVVGGGGRKAAQLRGTCEVIVSDLGDCTPLHDNLSAAAAAATTLFIDPAGRRLVIGGATDGDEAAAGDEHDRTTLRGTRSRAKKTHKHKKLARKATAPATAGESQEHSASEDGSTTSETREHEEPAATHSKKHRHKDSRSSTGNDAADPTEVAKVAAKTDGESAPRGGGHV